MNDRPEIKIVPKTIDKVLAYAGWIMLGFIWLFLVLNYLGKYFDNEILQLFYVMFSSRSLLVLTLTGTVFFIGMTMLMKFPWSFNYPVKVTDENAGKQYILAVRLISYLRFAMIFLFIVISGNTGGDAMTTIYLIIFTFALIFIPMMVLLGKMFGVGK